MDTSDTLISMFIDDEMDLDEKREFVDRVHTSREFRDETVALLLQERELRGEVVDEVPALAHAAVPVSRRAPFLPRPLVAVCAGMTAAVVVLSFILALQFSAGDVSHRFVIYEPDASRIDIAGSFTGWQRVPLERQGASGYWEITLDIPLGEHRFAYVLDSETRFADPTIPARERDDFGGENSILLAGTSS